jgi:hypothetical protein
VSYTLVIPLLVSLPALRTAMRERNAQILGLLLVALGLCGVYALFHIRDLEYKYILYARFPLALLMGMGFAHLRLAGRSATAVAILFTGFIVGTGTLSAPPGLPHAPKTSESGFQLTLDPTHPDSHWVRAIREQTPEDTVLLASGLQYHLGVFANRSVYFPVEVNGRLSAGFSLFSRLYLVQRGIPKPLIERRERVVNALYGNSARSFRPALEQMRSLSRPVALILPPGGGRQLGWLNKLGEGRLLDTDPEQSSPAERFVWFFEAR